MNQPHFLKQRWYLKAHVGDEVDWEMTEGGDRGLIHTVLLKSRVGIGPKQMPGNYSFCKQGMTLD